MHQFGAVVEIDRRLLGTPPSDQLVPGGEPEEEPIGAELFDIDDPVQDAAQLLVMSFRRRGVVGHDRDFDLLQVLLVAVWTLPQLREPASG